MGPAFAGSFVRCWKHLGTVASRASDYLHLGCSPFCFASGRLISSRLVFAECAWLHWDLILVPDRDIPLHPWLENILLAALDALWRGHGARSLYTSNRSLFFRRTGPRL